MTTGDATLEKSAGKTTKDDSLLSKTVETSLVDEESQRRLNNGSLWVSTRFVLAVIGFFGYIVLYSLKAYMGVAVVCMINYTALAQESQSSSQLASNKTHVEPSGGQCLFHENSTNGMKDGAYAWNTATKGLVLSSFFWGYLITQIPGGWLADRFGGKHVVGWFMFVTIATSFFIPIAAQFSPYAVIALRVLQGLGEGVVPPAINSLWSKWAPPSERSLLVGFTHAGGQIGGVITYPISGFLCDKGFAGGWPSIFYVFGMIGTVWFVLWMVLVSDSPDQHPRINDAEKKYIESCLGNVEEQIRLRKKMGTPWMAFITSRAVWATHIGFAVALWGTYIILTQLPTFMNEILHFNIKENGVLSALPFLAYWVMINISSILADKIRAKGVSTKTVRKVFFAIGCIGPAIFLVITGYVPCDMPYSAVATLTIAVGFCGFQYPGVFVNHVDIATPFAGILFGMSNTFGSLSGIIAPYTVQMITASKTAESWRLVFYITAIIYVVGAIAFALLAEGDIRPWAKRYIASESSSHQEKQMILEVPNGRSDEHHDERHEDLRE